MLKIPFLHCSVHIKMDHRNQLNWHPKLLCISSLHVVLISSTKWYMQCIMKWFSTHCYFFQHFPEYQIYTYMYYYKDSLKYIKLAINSDLWFQNQFQLSNFISIHVYCLSIVDTSVGLIRSQVSETKGYTVSARRPPTVKHLTSGHTGQKDKALMSLINGWLSSLDKCSLELKDAVHAYTPSCALSLLMVMMNE